jgi:hypothetical protein
MHNLIIQDILCGRGLCFIDPHGQDAQALLYRPDELVTDRSGG